MNELTKTYPRFRLQKYNIFLDWQGDGEKKLILQPDYGKQKKAELGLSRRHHLGHHLRDESAVWRAGHQQRTGRQFTAVLPLRGGYLADACLYAVGSENNTYQLETVWSDDHFRHLVYWLQHYPVRGL